MNQLAKLQHTFQDCVLSSDQADDTAWVSASGRADPATQLSIYSYAYAARLKEVLAIEFPAVNMAIGDDYFEQLTDDYIKNYPSKYFSLRDFGRDLPNFIASLIQQEQQAPIQWQAMPWLYELALFELSLGQAFDVADEKVMGEQDMAAIPPEAWPDLTFKLHPSVQRLNFEWNIPEMWQALTADEPTPVDAMNDTASPWLIWREQLITRYRSMQADEQLALDKLIEGANFNDICEALTSLMPEDQVPLHAAGLLKGWLAQGLISEIQ
ncbi:MAG: DNA-binding domain-containing protein [Gammaproteobacteria bacterium]|nr:DNA-binding domain-containing protein [Gammaproteobacteria bacterium]